MRTMPDETLMAYVDGELDPQTRETVGRALATDAALRARMEAFSMTREPLANLYSSSMREPVPDRLLDVILNGADAAQQKRPVTASRGFVGQGVWDFLLESLATPRFATAIAAVVLVGVGVGFGVGWSLTQGPIAQSPALDGPSIALAPGGIVAGGAFGRALEAAASGQSVRLDEADGSRATLRPFLSFATVQDGFCRQYELRNAKSAYAGLACRSADGGWHVLMHAPTVARPGYKPKEHRLSERKEPIDLMVDGMIVGDVMPLSREAELMKNGWKRNN